MAKSARTRGAFTCRHLDEGNRPQCSHRRCSDVLQEQLFSIKEELGLEKANKNTLVRKFADLFSAYQLTWLIVLMHCYA